MENTGENLETGQGQYITEGGEKLYTQAEVNQLFSDAAQDEKNQFALRIDAKLKELARREAELAVLESGIKKREDILTERERKIAEGEALSGREADLASREAKLAQKEETERLYNAAHYELQKKGIPEEFADIIDRTSDVVIQAAVHRLGDILEDMKLIRYAVEGNSKLRRLEELGDNLEGDGGLQMRRIFAEDGGRIRKDNRLLRKIFGLKGR
ncbi:MAG: hypothetical protein HFI88_11390 [Lachnospiraceae bacterium]|nr:hypothetical protein [Lachnospiraceae bacterium]